MRLLPSVIKSGRVDDAANRLYTHVPLSDNAPKRRPTAMSIVDQPISVAGRLPTSKLMHRVWDNCYGEISS